jgi:hypothetical protein
MNSNGWEVLFDEKLCKSHAPLYRFNKDHNLKYDKINITGEQNHPPEATLYDNLLIFQIVVHATRHMKCIQYLVEL